MTRIRPSRRLVSLFLTSCALTLYLQGAGMAVVPAGRIASHGIERDAVNIDGTGESAGYLTFIEGIAGPFFAGSPSEATAYFTFRSEQFSTQFIQNGLVTAVLHPPGRFTIYLNEVPAGDWNDFATFSPGQPIATFEYGAAQKIVSGSVEVGFISARLVTSREFLFHGRHYNFRGLIPHGVTIAFTINPMPLNASPPFIFTLGVSSFAIGGNAGDRNAEN